MRVGNFTVVVPEGRERDSGHVTIPHGTKYRIRLSNHWNNRACDAKVTIDGKYMGTFRIDATGTAILERPSHDNGEFTFYKADTAEFAAAAGGDVPTAERGLLQVEFTPEKLVDRKTGGGIIIPQSAFDQQGSRTYTKSGGAGGQHQNSTRSRGPGGQSLGSREYVPDVEEKTSGGILRGGDDGKSLGFSAGATGLSGESKQQFRQARSIEYDESERVTVSLRLVVAEDGPRPLTSAPKANPVPEPVS